MFIDLSFQVHSQRSVSFILVHFVVLKSFAGLARACELGEIELVKACLEVGADVNRPSLHNNGMTPLHFAVKCGSTSITRLLLQRGADTRKLADGDILPIAYSFSSMNFACADLLLRREQEMELKGEKLPEITPQIEMTNNLEAIKQQVEVFRTTGNKTGENFLMCDMRSDEAARAYDEQAQAKVIRKGVSCKERCSACGNYGIALKACSRCKLEYYCNKGTFDCSLHYLIVPRRLIALSITFRFVYPTCSRLPKKSLERAQSRLQKDEGPLNQ